jgi:hypothetical protein
VIILAFLVVAGSCALMIPVMLYVFQLHSKGWTWQYAALFGSMLASTDAVAIIATMKSSKLLPALLSNQTQKRPIHCNMQPMLSFCIDTPTSAAAVHALSVWRELMVVCQTTCQ